MFAVGHLALGYIMWKLSSRIFSVKMNIPYAFFFSILPDVDRLIPPLESRGPTHSIVVMFSISLPFLIAYRKNAIQCLLAAIQHSLMGDCLTSETQLLWPIDQKWYGLEASLGSVSTAIEWISFLASLAMMLKTGDLYELLKPRRLNLTLIAPAAAICSPLLIGFPLNVPVELIVPHIIVLAIFTFSILKDVQRVLTE